MTCFLILGIDCFPFVTDLKCIHLRKVDFMYLTCLTELQRSKILFRKLAQRDGFERATLLLPEL